MNCTRLKKALTQAWSFPLFSSKMRLLQSRKSKKIKNDEFRRKLVDSAVSITADLHAAGFVLSDSKKSGPEDSTASVSADFVSVVPVSPCCSMARMNGMTEDLTEESCMFMVGKTYR